MLSHSLATDENHMARTPPRGQQKGSAEVTAAFFQGTGPKPSPWGMSPGCQPLGTGGSSSGPCPHHMGLPSSGNRGQAGSWEKAVFMENTRQRCPNTHYGCVMTAGRSRRTVWGLPPAPSDSPFHRLARRGGICRFFQTMHGGVSDPSFCVFIHRVARLLRLLHWQACSLPLLPSRKPPAAPEIFPKANPGTGVQLKPCSDFMYPSEPMPALPYKQLSFLKTRRQAGFSPLAPPGKSLKLQICD